MAAFLLPTIVYCLAAAGPAQAQGLNIVRDTEIERVLAGIEGRNQ